jgi:tetratricopeptide (TPR) repeat protein
MIDSPSQSPRLLADLSGKRTNLTICVLLVAAVFLVFGQTLRHGFVNYDDDQYFYANPHVLAGLTGQGTMWAFHCGYANNWHPLTWLSLMLDAQCFGPGAAGPHLTNIILHAVSTVLLFLLLRRMTGARWRSAAVAAVFAIHPLHVESVAWVSERKDVLSGLFFMLTLLMYVRYVEKSEVQSPKSKVFYALSLLAFAGGLMSKPMLVTVPFVLLLLDWWPLNRVAGFGFKVEGSSVSSRRTLNLKLLVLEKCPFFLLSAGSGVVTVLAQREVLQSAVPLAVRLANAAVACVTYLGRMVWPVNLAAFYPYPDNIPVWETAGAGAVLITITGLVFFLARRFPYLLSGWLWYLGMLVPVLGLVQVGDQSHADRYAYLPLIGIALILAWGLTDMTASWRYQRLLLGAAAGGMMSALMMCAWSQTVWWRDGESLWRHALACTSNNYTAHNNLGYLLAAQGRTDVAVEHYQKALEIFPEYAEANNNLGRIFLNEGRLDEAKEYFQRAIRLKPGAAEAHNNLAIVLARQEDSVGAFQQYQTAIEHNPDFPEAYNNLAILQASQGRFAESEADYRAALALKPDYAQAHDNFGILLARQGRLAEAMSHFQKALEIRADSAEAENGLGLLLVSLEQAGDAAPHFQKALELKSDFAEAHFNLAEALTSQGRLAEAEVQLKSGLALAEAQGDATLADQIRTQMRFLETNSVANP